MTNKLLPGIIVLLTVVFSTNAQVGIGTTTPNSTLDVRGSLSVNYRVFTTSTSAATDNTLVFTGTSAATLTLPDATTCPGRVYYIKNASATSPTPVLTMATVSSQTIDGLTSWTLDEPNEVVSVVSNGVNWYVPLQDVPVGKTATTGGPWNQGGNKVTAAKALGTITNFDFPFMTNNTEKMRLSATGNLGIGTTTFDATNPEKLLVNAGTTTSYNVISGKGSINSFLQMNITNTSSAAIASTDLVATNDAGPYVDLGINSSGYNNAVNPILNGANNAYLYTTGGDFIIGDSTPAKVLKFFTGGTATTNERLRIDGSGNVGIGNISPNSTFEVSGSVGLSIITTTANITLDATHHTIILTGGTPIVTWPAAAAGNARRIYTIENQSGGARTTSAYLNLSGNSVATIATNSSITIQSDGTNWYRIQ